MDGKRVALYLRVSTDEQTIETQLQALSEAMGRRGWRIVAEFVDNGVSGAKGRDKRSFGIVRMWGATERLPQRQSWVEVRHRGALIRATLTLHGEAVLTVACTHLLPELE
jgi:hypothetical protein